MYKNSEDGFSYNMQTLLLLLQAFAMSHPAIVIHKQPGIELERLASKITVRYETKIGETQNGLTKKAVKHKPRHLKSLLLFLVSRDNSRYMHQTESES